MARAARNSVEPPEKPVRRGILAAIRRAPATAVGTRARSMALTSSSPQRRARPRRTRPSHAAPLLVSGAIGACALGIVTYLLWPSWGQLKANDPSRLPVSIGNTLFNVPTNAVRMKVQKRSGPQERVDLAFVWPSLAPPEAPHRVTAETVEETARPIDRLFLSIAAHHDALAPDERTRTIYPRYLDANSGSVADGLSLRAFREGTPYAGEDLATAEAPRLVARCTRDGKTPGMCLSERRVGGADLTFRFPRSWLAQWRDVAAALDTLAARLQSPRG
jgi:hypothetical protein